MEVLKREIWRILEALGVLKIYVLDVCILSVF